MASKVKSSGPLSSMSAPQPCPRLFADTRQRREDAGTKRYRHEQTIEHAEPEHRFMRVVQIGGPFGRHVEKLGIVPSEMLDDLCHADVGPARVEFASDELARFLGDAR